MSKRLNQYMVGPGNHEANCDNAGASDAANNITYTEKICLQGKNVNDHSFFISPNWLNTIDLPVSPSPGQTNFTGYINHFRMPSDVSGGQGNFWFSFDNGMVHYVQLDSETDLGHGLIGPDQVPSPQNTGPFGKSVWRLWSGHGAGVLTAKPLTPVQDDERPSWLAQIRSGQRRSHEDPLGHCVHASAILR
jgi:hypothetical protein